MHSVVHALLLQKEKSDQQRKYLLDKGAKAESFYSQINKVKFSGDRHTRITASMRRDCAKRHYEIPMVTLVSLPTA